MKQKAKPFTILFVVYLACYAVRMAELMLLRTDQSFFGEAFIQKIAGIVLLILANRYAGYTWEDIGFVRAGAGRGTLLGLALGLGVFAVAYATECVALSAAGDTPGLSFYVSAYALDGNVRGTTTFLTVAMCVLFNIVNVIMEEGIFRGLFTKLAQRRVSFLLANTIASLLFGLWHIALPIRDYVDGSMSGAGAFASGAVYVLTSFLMGFELGLLKRITGGLWAPMALHFVNNSIVNLLHVTTAAGNDPFVSLRITVAQMISFVIILLVYIKWHKQHAKNGKENHACML